MLSGFLQQVLLTRLVGLAEFGAFAVVNNVISIVNNTVVQATIQSVSKFTAEDDARAGAVQRAGVKMQAALGAVLALAIFFGAPLIAAFEEAPRYTTYFRIAAVIPFLYALYAVFVGSANGLRRFRTQASFDVGFSTAKTILLLGLAALWKVTGAFVGFAAAAAFILVFASRVMRLPSPAERFPMKRLAGFMSAVVAYGLLLNVALNYDLPLLHHFAGKSAGGAAAAVVAGHYQALRTLALLPYQALVVVTFVIFPLVSRATFAEDREATRLYVTQTPATRSFWWRSWGSCSPRARPRCWASSTNPSTAKGLPRCRSWSPASAAWPCWRSSARSSTRRGEPTRRSRSWR